MLHCTARPQIVHTRGQRKLISPCPPAIGSQNLGRLYLAGPLSSRNGEPCRALKEESKVMEAVAETVDAPFFEPAVRSMVLGLGAGVLLEVAHVVTKVSSFASVEGLAITSEVMEALAPLAAWDNLLAMTCCALFYGMEVTAIVPVLKKHGNNKEEAAKALRNTNTLPKRLMPVKLGSIKRALYALMALRNPAAALSHASAFRDGPDVRPDGPFLGSPRGVGTAVLERPPTSPPPSPRMAKPEAPVRPKSPTPQTKEASPKTPSEPATRAPRLGKVLQPKKAPAPTTAPGAAEKRQGLPPGAWDPTHKLPLPRRARELSERRSYLKNFWYAAALSQNLVAGKPLEVKMLGRTIVLFRDEDGVARCLDNLCPHRGAPLSKGWVKEMHGHTCVVCPYHGWAFDGTGVLRDVPSSPDQAHLPKRPLVDAYPVVEKGGFVYLFFGSKEMPADERPPVPTCPELSDPKWQPVYGEMEFESPHFSVFDNALDMAHIHYLHSDSFGNSEQPVIMDMQTKRDTWGITGSFKIHNKPVNAMWEWTKVESVPVEFAAWLPSTSYVKITLGNGVQMITYVNTVPIDANRSVNRFCLIRNFAGWEGFDIWARNAMYKILSEDKVMVELLRPEAMSKEVSLSADLPQIAFRKLRQEWVDMGYLAEPEATEAHNGSLDM